MERPPGPDHNVARTPCDGIGHRPYYQGFREKGEYLPEPNTESDGRESGARVGVYGSNMILLESCSLLPMGET